MQADLGADSHTASGQLLTNWMSMSEAGLLYRFPAFSREEVGRLYATRLDMHRACWLQVRKALELENFHAGRASRRLGKLQAAKAQTGSASLADGAVAKSDDAIGPPAATEKPPRAKPAEVAPSPKLSHGIHDDR